MREIPFELVKDPVALKSDSHFPKKFVLFALFESPLKMMKMIFILS